MNENENENEQVTQKKDTKNWNKFFLVGSMKTKYFKIEYIYIYICYEKTLMARGHGIALFACLVIRLDFTYFSFLK